MDNKKDKKVLYLLCIIIFYFYPIHPIVIGSNVTNSIEPFTTFPQIDSDNSIIGFAWMKNGFELENTSTSLVFNALNPVSGTIRLNGGIIELQEDLILKNIATLESLGTIIGNAHAFKLSSGIEELPSATFENLILDVSSDITITGTVIVEGHCILYGDGNVLTLSPGAEIIVNTNSNVEFENIQMKGVADNNIRCVDDTGEIHLHNCIWEQENDFRFENGILRVEKLAVMSGAYVFEYLSSQSSIIEKNSELHFQDAIELNIGKQTDITSVQPLTFEDQTSKIVFNNNTMLTVNENGINLIKGTLIINGGFTINCLGEDADTGIILGTGNQADDFRFIINPGALTTHTTGYITYNNYQPDLLTSLSHIAQFTRLANSHVYIAQDIVIPPVIIEIESNNVPPLEVTPGKKIEYNGTKVILPGVEFTIYSNQLNAFTYFMDGDSLISFSKGILPLFILVSGTNNVLEGNGDLANTVTLTDANTSLKWVVGGGTFNDIILNGGTLSLQNDLIFHSGTLKGSGSLELNTSNVTFNTQFQSFNDDLTISATQAEINVEAEIELNAPWTIEGNVMINGHGYNFDLSQLGEIIVTSESKLTLNNVILKGIKDSNLRCLDDTASIVLVNSEIVLADDYIFDSGSLTLFGENRVKGNYLFDYRSALSSQISASSKLSFVNGPTFSLGRSAVDSQIEPITFVDDTSILYLDNADFIVRSTGAAIKKGMVQLSRNVTVNIDSTDITNGLQLGDGTAENDAILQIDPGATIVFTKGHLIYNVTSPEAIRTHSTSTEFIRNDESVFHLKQSLILSDVTVNASINSAFTADPGITLQYDGAEVVLPTFGAFNITGSRHSLFSFELNGNESIVLKDGTYPLETVISGTNNAISGNGTVAGSIFLTDSSSQFTWQVNGPMANDIELNGGALLLLSDLRFTKSRIFGPGTISLLNNSIRFCHDKIFYNEAISWHGTGGTISLSDDITLTNTWTINGTVTIDGRDNILDLKESGEIVVAPNATLRLKDISILNLHGTNIHCIDDTGTIEILDSHFSLSGDVTFSKGQLECKEEAVFSGDFSVLCNSVVPIVVNSNTELKFTNHAKLIIGRNSDDPTIEPLRLLDSTSVLHLDNGVFEVKIPGMTFTKGTLRTTRLADIIINSSGFEDGLAFGDGTTEGDVFIELNPGSTIRFVTGHVTLNLTKPDLLVSLGSGAIIERSDESRFNVVNNFVLKNLQVTVTPQSGLTVSPSASFYYDNTQVTFEQGSFNVSGKYITRTSILLNGSQKIIVDNGFLPIATLIAGSTNYIEGNGNVFGPVIFQDPEGSLIWQLNGVMSADINLNGGSLMLGSDLKFIFKGIKGPGTVSFLGNRLVTSGEKQTIDEPITFNGASLSGTIELRNDIDIAQTVMIQGDITIDGNNYVMSCAELGEFIINTNSTLTLRNIQLRDITEEKIRCIDDTGKLVLDNVIWHQAGDYIFKQGSLQCNNKVSFNGTGILDYQANQPFVIKDKTITKLQNLILRYNPSSTSSDLLVFQTKDSVLKLQRGGLHSFVDQLNLTQGEILIQGESCLISEGGIIELGNGTSEQDFKLTIDIGSKAQVSNTILRYKNVSQDKVQINNEIGMLQIDEGSSFELYQSINLNNGVIKFENNTILARALGKKIFGSISVKGNLLYKDIQI